MIYVYRNTLMNRMKFLWGIYLTLIICIALIFLLTKKFGYNDFNVYLNIALTVFIVSSIPTIYLHIQYVLKSAYVKIIVDDQKGEVSYCTRNETITFSPKDVTLLEQFKTPPLAENRWPWFPWLTYN